MVVDGHVVDAATPFANEAEKFLNQLCSNHCPLLFFFLTMAEHTESKEFSNRNTGGLVDLFPLAQQK